MLKNLSKIGKVITPLKKTPKFWNQDQWKKRDEAAEKEFMLRQDQQNLKNLQRRKDQDQGYRVVPDEYDAHQVLLARDSLVKILTEQGIGINDEVLVKRLISWKFKIEE